MSDVYREVYFINKLFTYELNMGLPLQLAWVEKTVPGMEIHRLPGKEKISGTTVNKEVHADSLLGYEKIQNYWFHEKGIMVNNAFFCQFLKQNSPYLLNNPCIYYCL